MISKFLFRYHSGKPQVIIGFENNWGVSILLNPWSSNYDAAILKTGEWDSTQYFCFAPDLDEKEVLGAVGEKIVELLSEVSRRPVRKEPI